MKKLKEIIEKNNFIHASIHKKDRNISEDFSPDQTIAGYEKKIKHGNDAAQPMHEHLSKHYDLNQSEHKSHLLTYSDDSYDVNSNLWKSHTNGRMTKAEKSAGDMVKHYDAAVSAFKSPRRFTVHSGINYDPSERKDSNNLVKHPAYLSTSLNKEKAKAFSEVQKGNIKHVISLDVPKGSHGVYIGEHSYNADEREFLMPRGAVLRHKSTEITKEHHHIYGDLNVHTHNMEWVNH